MAIEEVLRNAEDWREIEVSHNELCFQHENGLIVDFDATGGGFLNLYLRTPESMVRFAVMYMVGSQSLVERLKRCVKFPDDIYNRVREVEEYTLEQVERIVEETDDEITGWETTEVSIRFVDADGHLYSASDLGVESQLKDSPPVF